MFFINVPAYWFKLSQAHTLTHEHAHTERKREGDRETETDRRPVSHNKLTIQTNKQI